MQSFNIDISSPGGPMVIYAMQADSLSRFISIVITSNGAPWEAPDGAAWTVRFGAPGMPAGWYDTITEAGGGSHAAVVVDENTATVEIAEQAISTPGQNILCVLVTDAQGYQIASWPFLLNVQAVPGLESPEVTVYYNALTEQVAQTLANSQAAAASATSAESWAVGGTGTRPGENTNNAQYWCNQAQTISGGNLGWYENEEALKSVHPTGQNGQWAIIGSTDTIWTWDSDTSAWVDSGNQVDLSNYYTKSQADESFAPKSHTSSSTAYGTATASLYGHTKLSDTASSTYDASSGVAATPKCVQDSISANEVSVSFKNGATDYGTHLYRIGNIVVGVIELYAPDTISAGGWVTYLRINTPPAYRVNGRAAFGAAGSVRDYLITAGASGGDFNVFVNSVDAGKTLNIPIAYVVKV